MGEKIVPVAEYYTMYGLDLGQAGSQEISQVERLMSEFEAHESQEARFVQCYKDIAEKTKNPVIRFLLQIIISDEEKHHGIAHAMASTLRGSLDWTEQKDALRGLYDLGKDREDLLEVTEDFIRLEKEGIKEYKRLVKDSRRYYHGLFALLFGVMIRDSEKHIAVLEFLREKLRKE